MNKGPQNQKTLCQDGEEGGRVAQENAELKFRLLARECCAEACEVE
jgi:hypothetical protein